MATINWLFKTAKKYTDSIGLEWCHEEDPCLENQVFDSGRWRDILKESVVRDDIKIELLDHRDHQDWAWVVAIPIEGHPEFSHWHIICDRSFTQKHINVNIESIDFDRLYDHVECFLKTTCGDEAVLDISDVSKIVGLWLEFANGSVDIRRSGNYFIEARLIRKCIEVLAEAGLFEIFEKYDNPFSNIKANMIRWHSKK